MSTHSSGAIGADNHTLDELTAASSRRDFLAELDAAKLSADREALPFVLCLVDIDQLRNVNDRHGQDAGDAVLRELAERTQVLIITHNKGTMEAADVLYGVTMEIPGVSKIISMRLTKKGIPEPVPVA